MTPPDTGPAARRPAVSRSLVLIGLMGAGKTHVGRRLATRLGLPFTDADQEIEAAAGEDIESIFRRHGEDFFRDGERRVIGRLLDGPVGVIATGGGAFMNPETRAHIGKTAVSIWLRADLGLLMRRIARRNDRPLLKQGDPKAIMERLMAERYPVYEGADITVDAIDGPPGLTVDRIVGALATWLSAHPEAAGKGETEK